MRFNCKTLFDITATGVTGHYRSARVPFNDLSGNPIENEKSWNHARNQQRNWETLTQLIGLRSQIAKLGNPKKSEGIWSFEFEVDTPYVYGSIDNPTEMLLSDCAGVPMLIQLENTRDIAPYLIVDGNNQNIWFDVLD
jgi:hypothetical protein